MQMAHEKEGIEKMIITNDDKYLITAGKDGSILLFEIKDRDAKRLLDGYSKFSEEILVTKNDLEELRTLRDILNQKLQDFRT